jgi:hypothetical protein
MGRDEIIRTHGFDIKANLQDEDEKRMGTGKRDICYVLMAQSK